LIQPFQHLDDDHVAATAWTWRCRIGLHDRNVVGGRLCDPKQLTGALEMGLARGAREQAIMADTVETLGKDVQQEAADELTGLDRHDLLSFGIGAAVILVAKVTPASSNRIRRLFEMATRCV